MKAYSFVFILLLILSSIIPAQNNDKYIPTWESLDKRPFPDWFQDAKLGIFIHWGVYSVPSYNGKGQYAEWYYKYWKEHTEPIWSFHKKVYGENYNYTNFAKDFTATFYDPDEWASFLEKSGAKYVVLTSKHHDGYCLWPSEQRKGWNAVDNGPGIDLIGTLANSVRKTDVRFGLYYSLAEWYNPIYNWTYESSEDKLDKYVNEYMIPQFTDLVNRYKPDIIFSDGDWDHTSDEWQTKQILSWLYNHKDIGDYVVVNDRWGKDVNFKRTGYFATEYTDGMENSDHPWEECRGIGASFGFNRNESIYEYQTAPELIKMFVSLVSKGGNLLLNIGPTADGRIPVIMQERLLQLGNWLSINGDAIYNTRPWKTDREGENIFYTMKKDSSEVYAITFDLPEDYFHLLNIKPKKGSEIYLLGYDKPLEWSYKDNDGTRIKIPSEAKNNYKFPEDIAFAFKITGTKTTLSKNYHIETELNNSFDTLNFTGKTKLSFPEKSGTHYYYTLDGSKPEYENSVKYDDPIEITESTTVRYFTQAGGKVRSLENKVYLNKLEYEASVDIDNPEKGLKYTYYEENIRNFSEMTDKQVRTGITHELHPSAVQNRNSFFQIRFEGLFHSNKDQLYKFFLRSDDGSRLYINDRLIINNDGVHDAEEEKIGEIALAEGYHSFRVDYFDVEGGKDLILEYTTDNINRIRIEGNELYHTN